MSNFRGRNDKGMVTYDRQTLKDAYYFYKANWNPEPMLHLCSLRFTQRKFAETSVRAYTTLPNAILYVNGEKISKMKPDDVHVILWKNIILQPGDNTIEVRSGDFSEQYIWHF